MELIKTVQGALTLTVERAQWLYSHNVDWLPISGDDMARVKAGHATQD